MMGSRAKRKRRAIEAKQLAIADSQGPPAAGAASIPDRPAESESVPPVAAEANPIDRDVYNEERKLLIELEQAAADRHDESILKLASGALALTITFLEKIAANPKPESAILIRVSWACLIVCIFMMLFSFLTSQWALRRQRTILDNLAEGKKESDRNFFGAVTAWLNPLSYLTFVAGIGFATAFAWANFEPDIKVATEGATHMADQSQPQKPSEPRPISISPPEKAQGGYVPPTPPAPPSGTKKDTPPKKEK